MRRGVKKQQGKKGAIRIISGQWRGRKLPVLDAEGLRPTTDRNKETLFNWLMHDTHGSRCLDVFAGSGGLGFEALSRYAAFCQFIEKDKNNARQLSENIQLIGLEGSQANVIHQDALDALKQLQAPFDVIFLDPPFHQNLLEKSISLIEEHGLLAPDGVIYIEHEAGHPALAIPNSWQLEKDRNNRQVIMQVYRKHT